MSETFEPVDPQKLLDEREAQRRIKRDQYQSDLCQLINATLTKEFDGQPVTVSIADGLWDQEVIKSISRLFRVAGWDVDASRVTGQIRFSYSPSRSIDERLEAVQP